KMSCDSIILINGYVFLYLYLFLVSLHSFPTRRSSDLGGRLGRGAGAPRSDRRGRPPPDPVLRGRHAGAAGGAHRRAAAAIDAIRSEEHTSELQSRENLVCRLFLEKNNIYCILERKDLD